MRMRPLGLRFFGGLLLFAHPRAVFPLSNASSLLLPALSRVSGEIFSSPLLSPPLPPVAAPPLILSASNFERESKRKKKFRRWKCSKNKREERERERGREGRAVSSAKYKPRHGNPGKGLEEGTIAKLFGFDEANGHDRYIFRVFSRYGRDRDFGCIRAPSECPKNTHVTTHTYAYMRTGMNKTQARFLLHFKSKRRRFR